MLTSQIAVLIMPFGHFIEVFLQYEYIILPNFLIRKAVELCLLGAFSIMAFYGNKKSKKTRIIFFTANINEFLTYISYEDILLKTAEAFLYFPSWAFPNVDLRYIFYLVLSFCVSFLLIRLKKLSAFLFFILMILKFMIFIFPIKINGTCLFLYINLEYIFIFIVLFAIPLVVAMIKIPSKFYYSFCGSVAVSILIYNIIGDAYDYYLENVKLFKLEIVSFCIFIFIFSISLLKQYDMFEDVFKINKRDETEKNQIP